MGSNTFFDNPPVLRGTEKDQLEQLQRYLASMSEQLNYALMSISIEQMTEEAQAEVRTSQAEAVAQTAGLKEMIVKTAQIVRHEMDELSTRLTDSYVALSDQFGTYERNLDTRISATAQGVMQNYHFDERITAVDSKTESFKRQISQFIFTGIVDEVTGKVGIAIGENVTQQDGTLNTTNRMATFTMDEMAFWQGNTKLGYYKNNMFHIAQGEVTDSFKMGNHTWKILTGGSIGLISG